MLTLGLENLHLRPTTTFAKTLHAKVIALKTRYQGMALPPDAGSDLTEVIRTHTRLNATVSFSPRHYDNYILSPNVGVNHSGVSQVGVSPSKEDARLTYLSGFIDLEKIIVSGSFTKVPFKIVLSWPELMDYPAEETTATLLHEVGHAFNFLATLGEYVWLNYYLQEGAEVLLGRKPSRLRFQAIDAKTLKTFVDPETKKLLEKDPSPAVVKTAVLNYYLKQRRGHLSSITNVSSYKRNEQMADWFCARLGFGLPMAQSLARTVRRGKTPIRDTMMMVAVLTAAMGISAPVFALPFGALLTLYGSHWLHRQGNADPYDTRPERFRKLRQEILIQLRTGNLSPEQRELYLTQLDTFDKLITDLAPYQSKSEAFFERFIHANAQRQIILEQELESLMNNNLYATHSRLMRYL